jgi:FSR family fosmidomycin resistance protein-like MFS transporter
MASLSLGHLAADLAQGAPPALLVFLVPHLDLSYTMAAAVILAATVSSSIVQPLFGHWSDRRGGSWLLASGVALAGVGVAVAPVAPNYALLLLFVFFSGVGVGAFHPEGAKFAGAASGERRASGMAAFSIGGSVGFALGPLLASSAILAFGLEGGLVVAAPCLLVAALLVRERPYLVRCLRRQDDAARDVEPLEPQTRPFTLLQIVVVLRSVAYAGLFTFVPLWEVAQGSSERHGTLLLTYLLAAGAAGTIVAGPLADRFGRRTVMLWSLVLAGPLMLVYVLVGGAPGEVAIVGAGAAIVGTFGVSLVMSQEYLPGRVALASGVSVGLAIGLGGVTAVVLGALADTIDLRTALIVSAVAPMLGALLTLPLPRAPRPARSRAAEAASPI